MGVESYEKLLKLSDAVYIRSLPQDHYSQIKLALNEGKHVICESPLTLDTDEANELYDLAKKNKVVLMDAIKTAYSTAYLRLLLLIKSGKIGDVISLDSTCTSLAKHKTDWPGFLRMGSYCFVAEYSNIRQL